MPERTRKPRLTRSPAPSAASQRMRVLMLERMASFAVREIAEQILDSALAHSGQAFVPVGGARLTIFAHGPLQELVRHHLGDDAADALLEDLHPLLRMSAEDEEEQSSVRSRLADSSPMVHVERSAITVASVHPHTSQTQIRAVELHTPAVPSGPRTSAPTVRPDNNAALVVVVSSLDPRRAFALGAALGSVADVRVADDLVELVDTLLELAEHAPFLVLDGSSPALHAATLSATLPELPEGITVVLWGYEDAELAEIRALVEGSDDFRTFGADVDADDLAALLRLA